MKGMLSIKELHQIIRKGFLRVKDTSAVRKRPISLTDHLMSGFALFSLKYPSLLRFDQDSRKEKILHNLQTVFNIKNVPSDTQMRERLDEVDPKALRVAFKMLFAQCQRSKHLELFKFYQDRYLMPLDGTGYFNSQEVHCNSCCEKHHQNGTISYYHQMLSGAIVHPDQKVVIPFAPEPVIKSDGTTKNDCECRAAERFLDDLKREHPHLKLIITGDSLFSNGPFIKRLKEQKQRFILVAKETNHKTLFEEFRALPKKAHEIPEGKINHRFQWLNQVPLNDSHPDCLVNVLEYREENESGKKLYWVWVTDIPLTEENVYQVMKGGRARHKIENETFNTLKNQGYEFEHNFGHGEKNLSTVFCYLMMLAFLVDQLQQLGCKVFQKALARLHSKRALWEHMRGLFFHFKINSVEDLWLALSNDHVAILSPNTS